MSATCSADERVVGALLPAGVDAAPPLAELTRPRPAARLARDGMFTSEPPAMGEAGARAAAASAAA